MTRVLIFHDGMGGRGGGNTYYLYIRISYFLDFFVCNYKYQERLRILEDFMTIYGVRAMVLRKVFFMRAFFNILTSFFL